MLERTGADELRVAAGEIPYVLTGGQRRDIAAQPIQPRVVLNAAVELLSQEELDGLPSNRPRTVRHEHAGTAYVIEVARGAAGIVLTVRGSKGGRAVRPIDLAAPAPPAAHASAQAAHAPAPHVAEVAASPAAAHGIELATAPRHAQPAPQAPQAPARAPEPSRVPDLDLRTAAPATVAAAGAAAVAPAAPATAVKGRHRIDGLLEDMLASKASDLHLSSNNHPIMRVHGEMHFVRERAVLTSGDIRELLREIMPEKAARDFEELRDADFAYELPGRGRFRVNAFEDRNGTGAVLRQIPIDIISADKLGLPKACTDLCYLSKGLVVVTGPTGSGKSTTLAAMIDHINKNRSDHIITIEDPVEFVHKNIKCLVNQREVGQNTKSFKNALRAALREDPDIVLVGEMRDLETISIAIETAETGHLVFGTLHTTTAVSTVDRIIDQFPSDRQSQVRVMLSESLKGVVAQTLCKKTGGGRVAAHEIMLGTSAVAALIRDAKTFQIQSVIQTSKSQGMLTLNDSLMNLVQKGLVDPKEAWMKAVDKTGLLTMFKNAGLPTSFV